MFRKIHAFLILPFFDLIYPPACLSCDRRQSDRSSIICGTCRGSLTPLESGHPVLCEFLSRFKEAGSVSDLLSCFLFEKTGTMREIVHQMKYGGMTSAGIEFGKILGRQILDGGRHDTPALLVPVPLHRIRRRERGYNQSESICRGIAAVTGMSIRSDLLIRKSNTSSQTKLTLEERRENVKVAFAVNEKRGKELHDADIILVDDVITTGATIEACARTLLAAGAARVSAASIAIAEQKNAAPAPLAPHAQM